MLEAITADVKKWMKSLRGSADQSRADKSENRATGSQLEDAVVCTGSSKNCCKMRANKAEGPRSRKKPGTGTDSVPFD